MGDSSPATGGGTDAGSLWGGRFSGGLDPRMDRLNRSLDVDLRLWREDIRGSRAWTRALGGAGVITSVEMQGLLDGLDRVAERFGEEDLGSAPEEDVHTLVERMLREEVGALAGKLHTGRSRNDQVATDLRLWGMAASARAGELLGDLAHALTDLAERSIDCVIPGYTHLQQGQPVRAAHWAMSHVWPLLRDRESFRHAARGAGVLPLGSGALAGCPFPVDRVAIAEELGFESISENSMDAVSDRDWALRYLFAASVAAIHLSRLGEDMVLFQTREFGILRLPESFTTGSSLMPQKRNPDVAELTRGKSGRVVGDLIALITIAKGLPTGYNRDLQEDKATLFDAADTIDMVLPAMAGAVEGARFDVDRSVAILGAELLATDLADHLVREGVPFREAHEIVGHLVREAEDRGIPVDQLPNEVFAAAHPAFPADTKPLFDPVRSVEARSAAGGTARAQVLSQIADARERIARG